MRTSSTPAERSTKFCSLQSILDFERTVKTFFFINHKMYKRNKHRTSPSMTQITLWYWYIYEEYYFHRKTSFWIGLHDVNKAGLFQWSDCSPVTTSYWGNTSQTEGKYCVSANPKDLSWQIHPCTDLLPAVCETPEPCMYRHLIIFNILYSILRDLGTYISQIANTKSHFCVV